MAKAKAAKGSVKAAPKAEAKGSVKKKPGGERKRTEAPASKAPALTTRRPDASADELADHAGRLAAAVREHAEALLAGRVTVKHAEALDAGAQKLREAEAVWAPYRDGRASGDVDALREQAMRGRTDLFSGLRSFVSDATVQMTLDAVAGVEDDADLQQDLETLDGLARKHAKKLVGTDVTPKRVDEIKAEAKAFLAARMAQGPSGAARLALSKEGRKALAKRDAAFWALADLDRKVCVGARHALRHRESLPQAFHAYTTGAKGAAAASGEAGGGSSGGAAGGDGVAKKK